MLTNTRLIRAALLASLVTASALAPAMAQTPNPATDDRTVVREYDDRDRGFDDWGLLGLLGLLGLIPRKRHDVVVHDVNRNTNPNDPTRR